MYNTLCLHTETSHEYTLQEAIMEVSRRLLDSLKAEKILAQPKPGKKAAAQVKDFVELFK